MCLRRESASLRVTCGSENGRLQVVHPIFRVIIEFLPADRKFAAHRVAMASGPSQGSGYPKATMWDLEFPPNPERRKSGVGLIDQHAEQARGSLRELRPHLAGE